MRKSLLIILVVGVVAASVAILGPRLSPSRVNEQGAAALEESTSGAQQQTIISVRGVVQPVRWRTLSFPMGGVVHSIDCVAGITVTVGQPLATLVQDELEAELQLRKSELALRQAVLSKLQSGPSPAEVSVATANHDAAVAAYDQLRRGPSEQEKTLAAADLKKAQLALQRAQASYDSVRNLPDIGARPEAMQLEHATVDYERAKAAYDLSIKSPSAAEMKRAESLVISTKAALDALKDVDQSAAEVAEAERRRAEVVLTQARLALTHAKLLAPFEGTITSLAGVQPGDTVDAGGPVLTIADLAELEVEIVDLDEWGAANVTLNQTVDLIVPSLGNRTLRGRVLFVADEPTTQSNGATYYRAVVGLEKQDPDLRWGNSVRIRLYVAGAHGVGFR